MSSARRPLLTATAAATLLCALWFVPSAKAAQESPAHNPAQSQTHTTVRASAPEVADDTRLADTGSPDTTPYVVGGTLFLGLGAGFVVYSVRRERMGF